MPPVIDSLLDSAASGELVTPQSEYTSIIALCWITPIRCEACNSKFQDARIDFTALRRGHAQRVVLQFHDPSAFLIAHPDATRRVEIREEETIPFCTCAKEIK